VGTAYEEQASAVVVDESTHTGDMPFRRPSAREHGREPTSGDATMTTVLIILAIVLVVVIAMGLMGSAPARIRRRTVVERPTRRVVEEPVVRERVVEDRATEVRRYEE
jgi:hypothetical protein